MSMQGCGETRCNPGVQAAMQEVIPVFCVQNLGQATAGTLWRAWAGGGGHWAAGAWRASLPGSKYCICSRWAASWKVQDGGCSHGYVSSRARTQEPPQSCILGCPGSWVENEQTFLREDGTQCRGSDPGSPCTASPPPSASSQLLSCPCTVFFAYSHLFLSCSCVLDVLRGPSSHSAHTTPTVHINSRS